MRGWGGGVIELVRSPIGSGYERRCWRKVPLMIAFAGIFEVSQLGPPSRNATIVGDGRSWM